MSDLATAAVFTWLGMVLAISFLETPLKFRAPDVTVRIGLGIGRLVFRALNVVECVFAAMLLVAITTGDLPKRVVVSMVVAVVCLVIQIGVVRPRLTRRTDLVLAGEDVPRSRGHLWYVLLEVIKVVALIMSGLLILQL